MTYYITVVTCMRYKITMYAHLEEGLSVESCCDAKRACGMHSFCQLVPQFYVHILLLHVYTSVLGEPSRPVPLHAPPLPRASTLQGYNCTLNLGGFSLQIQKDQRLCGFVLTAMSSEPNTTLPRTQEELNDQFLLINERVSRQHF